MKYRKKAVVIDAIQFDGSNTDEIIKWAPYGKITLPAATMTAPVLFIHTLEGIMSAGVGDFIIRGVKGEFYPCKPDVFEMTYEPL